VPRKNNWLVLILVVDQVLKYLTLSSGWPVVLNKGIAFGLITSEVWVVIVVLVLVFLVSSKDNSLGVGLLLVGGLSNLIDRLTKGAVVDYIVFGEFLNFNLADVAIVLGGVWLLAKRYNKADEA